MSKLNSQVNEDTTAQRGYCLAPWPCARKPLLWAALEFLQRKIFFQVMDTVSALDQRDELSLKEKFDQCLIKRMMGLAGK